ncbi:PAQR family membrane homeostasis protein TrhA [Clostridium mediterraneense]|uniref:PAQR family membrane homeostasis protein TrhA n=1 Tax=Clostridium mediterraneense TaxID=1805472 RepID=UPI000836F83D|nr:hemolysin III family protein [Clostridium mediterraneense]
MNDNFNFYTLGEEIANAITHGLGLLLAIAGTVVLIVMAAFTKDPYKIVSVSIYGFTLIMLYLGSTLYHSIPGRTAKKVFRIIDHSTIFLLIAGSYTPFTLIVLRQGIGWYILGAIWLIAIIGIVFKAVCMDKLSKLSTWLYILMGWTIVIDIKNVISNLEVSTIVLLVAGGLSYTLGCIFFAKDDWKFNHAIWHLFVMAGSIFQYFAIMQII